VFVTAFHSYYYTIAAVTSSTHNVGDVLYKWTNPYNHFFDQATSMGVDGVVVTAFVQQSVYGDSWMVAWNTSGQLLWQTQLPSPTDSNFIVGVRHGPGYYGSVVGSVDVVGIGDRLYVLNHVTGVLLWVRTWQFAYSIQEPTSFQLLNGVILGVIANPYASLASINQTTGQIIWSFETSQHLSSPQLSLSQSPDYQCALLYGWEFYGGTDSIWNALTGQVVSQVNVTQQDGHVRASNSFLAVDTTQPPTARAVHRTTNSPFGPPKLSSSSSSLSSSWWLVFVRSFGENNSGVQLVAYG